MSLFESDQKQSEILNKSVFIMRLNNTSQLHQTTPHYIMFSPFTPHYTTLHHILSHHTTPHYTTSCHVSNFPEICDKMYHSVTEFITMTGIRRPRQFGPRPSGLNNSELDHKLAKIIKQVSNQLATIIKRVSNQLATIIKHVGSAPLPDFVLLNVVNLR